MFKLESYVTPWLLGYLDQYVKLRPEDLQLSLWGGDAVLYNLDLRLDVLQKVMHLPIVFKSGHIHELRLHVPWTKLGSEPMVITINTVECIVKVRDYSDASSSASSSSTAKPPASSRRRKLKRQAAEDLPPGYLQSILNRVVNNMTFIVNNMILKFVEDDIVLSVNVKSAECYSCDGCWNRAFVDITPEDLILRKMIHFSDLTVCLDKTNADGHIENYQEPMLYRCFLSCRLHMTYDNVHSKMPTQTKLNVLCEKLDGLVSDTQLPMFLRLVELCLALYYGYLDGSAHHEQGVDSIHTSSAQEPSTVPADDGEREEEEEEEKGEDQGWGAWMWSMVPQILPEEEEESYHKNQKVDKPPILSVGFYIQQASLTFKVTEMQRDKGRGRHKLTFHPFLVVESWGLGVELLVQGMTFFNAQFGMANFTLTSAGPCICGQPAGTSLQELQILRLGNNSRDGGELTYDWGSLFDPSCTQNRGKVTSYVVDREEHMRLYTERYSQQRFSAFWLDYLSTLVLPASIHSGSQSSDSDFSEGTLFQQEASTCRFVFGPSLVQLSSSTVHRVHKVLCYAWNHHYEPYRKEQHRKESVERVQLTESQVAGLEECIPTVSYHVTLLTPTLLLAHASHPVCNVSAKNYSTPATRRTKGKAPLAAGGSGEDVVEMWASAERFDVQIVSPMYPAQLVKLVSNIAGPSSNLMYHCHSHTQLKVFSLQAGLERRARKGVTCRPVILLPPCSLAFYFRHLLLPHLWNNSHLSLWEHSYELPQLTITVSKASLLATIHLLSSWTHPQSSRPAHRLSIIADLFPPHNETGGLSVLELSVCGVEVRGCHTALVQAYTGSLSSIQLLLYTPKTDQKEAGTLPILYGPVDSGPVVDRSTFQQQPVSCLRDGTECVAFTVQKPHHTSTTEAPALLVVSVAGVACCVDPGLLQWFSYTPSKQPPGLAAPTPAADFTPIIAVDLPLAKATSPLQPNSSQMSVRSGSSQTQPTSTSRLFSHSHTPSHSQSVRDNTGQHGQGSLSQPASPLDSLTSLLTSAFPLLRMMQVQVDMKSSNVFVPKTTVCVSEASGDIAANIQRAWQGGEVEEVVIVCLPTISVRSVGGSAMDVLQDIPITKLHGALLSEKLPWTVEMSEWSMYTLHAGGKTHPVVWGLAVSSTVGATVHYDPPTSDLIHSLALCLHLDFQPLQISLSHSQVPVLRSLADVVQAVGGASWQLAEHCLHQLIPYTPLPAEEGGDREQEGGRGADQASSHIQPEPSLTGGTPDMGEGVTTDLSDDVCHASPLHAVLSPDLGEDAAIKLSVWLQCVLPRFCLALFTPCNSEVCMFVEDVAMSWDLQPVYSKLKATVGSISFHRYTVSEAGDRVKDRSCPVLVSTCRELPQSVYTHSNKGWTFDGPAVHDRFTARDSFSTDAAHGFFSLTLTRALCKSVRKKMRKLNVDLSGLSDREDSPAATGDGLYFHQFVSEVCIKVEPIDVVFHFPTFTHLLGLWHTWCRDSPRTTHLHLVSEVSAPGRDRSSSARMSAHTLPLIYIDVAALRLFLPTADSESPIQDIRVTKNSDSDTDVASPTSSSEPFCLDGASSTSRNEPSCLDGASSTSRSEPSCPDGASGSESQTPISTLSHNFLLVQWGSLHMQPYADNPLPRYPVQRDLFQRALQCGMTQQTGSCVEDRQYQLSVHSLAMASGTWNDLVSTLQEKSSHTKSTPGVQIPALEWNTFLGHRPAVKELEVIPIVTAFDLCLVVAPPIVYTGVSRNQHILVCGVTAELNVVSDLDLHLSTQQLALMTSIMNLALTLTHGRSSPGQGYQHDIATSGLDSGVASETSTVHGHFESGQKDTQDSVRSHVPANVLLTAGRISLTLYTHMQLQSDLTLKPLPLSSSPQTSPGKQRHHRIKQSTASADNFASLIGDMPDMSHVRDEGCVDFDFLQPRAEGVRVRAGMVCVQPLMYVYLAQPHTVVSTGPSTDRLELSCYDVMLKGPPQHSHIFPVKEHRVMPDLADFPVSWIETRAGMPDTNTGIPPCLLTLRISGLLTLPGDFELKVERPVKVSVSQESVQQVGSVVQHMAAALKPPTPPPPAAKKRQGEGPGPEGRHHTSEGLGQPLWITGVLGVLRQASLHTDQVMLSLEGQDSKAASGLVTSVASIALALQQDHTSGPSTRVHGSMNWKDIVIKTIYNKNARLLAGPVTVATDMVVQWPAKGYNTSLHVVLGVQSGLLLVQLGQEHMMSLCHLVSLYQTQRIDDSAPKSEKRKCREKTEDKGKVHLRPDNTSHDDLRSGMFVFIHDEENRGVWPLPYQAVISGEEEGGGMDSALTWAYPQPRCVTALTSLPVPLGRLSGHADQHPVRCDLQLWNECTEEFVSYASFELCGDSSVSLHLPQVRQVDLTRLATAQVWRVLVCGPSSSQHDSSAAPLTGKSRVLLAAQLAGSMCVDSAHVSQLVPSLQVSLAVGKIYTHLYNHLQYNGTGGSGSLQDFKIAREAAQDQQWCVVSVDRVTLLSTHFTGPLARSTLQVGCEMGMEVVDYGTLTMQSVVDQVEVSCTAHLQHHLQGGGVKLDVKTSPIHVHVGRSMMHTINTSIAAWTEFGERTADDPGLVFAHLILCNNTQQALRCGQAGTDENILLHSGHMLPYSWRSFTSKQHLHFCVDHATWRWCTPVDVSSEGHCVRVVRARDQRYTLIVQITQLSPIHKKVTVSGQFLVCSQLSQPLEVRFQLHEREREEGERESVWVVGRERTPPSLVAEHEDLKGFSVRLAGSHPTLPWSHPLHLSGHAMTSSQLIKVMLPDGSSYFHVWCRIFCQNFSETRQKLIFLSPLYVLRSHLPLPLNARLFTPHNKQQQMLQVTGQGQEYQLHCTGGDITHQLFFRLGPGMVESSPPLVLSSGLVEQVEQAPLGDVDIEALCQQTPPSLDADWPYHTLEPCSDSGGAEKQWSEVEQAGVDVNVQLSHYLPGCRTLLVDISPWCLLTNLTPLPLLLLTDTHCLKLPQGCTMAPPALQELRVGCECEGQVWEGAAIPLSEDEVEQHLYSPDLGRVLYLDGQVQIQVLLPPAKPGGLTQVVPLCVVSAVKHKVRVVTISERLRLTNMTGCSLHTQLMAVPHTLTSSLSPAHFPLTHTPLLPSKQGEPSVTKALLSWQLLQDSTESLAQPSELVLYMTFTLALTSQHAPVWSSPVRVTCVPEGSRSTVMVGSGGGGCGGGVSLCVTSVVEGAVIYLVVSNDHNPMCWIHNLCPFPLQYGQAVLKVTTAKGLVVQEETELVWSVPVVDSQCWSHYTMPHVNATFPQIDIGPPPRLHVRPVVADRQQGEWSAGIRLEPGDCFLHMTGLEHTKVHVERLCMVYHITLTTLSKAEVSAREVRSRIQGGATITRIEETSTKPSIYPSHQAVGLERHSWEKGGGGDTAKIEQHLVEKGGVVNTMDLEKQLEKKSSDGDSVKPLVVQSEGWPPLSMGVAVEAVVVTLHDDVSRPGMIGQLLQVEISSLLLACYPVGGSHSSLCLALCAGGIQVDNILAHRGLYDFPVILQPQNTLQASTVTLAPHQDLSEVHAMARASSMIHLQVVISKDPLLPQRWFLDSVEVGISPLSVYIEDTFFFHLYEECQCLLPHLLRGKELRGQRQGMPRGVWEQARLQQQPLLIRRLCLSPVSLLLSVHASVRLFLATDQAPLRLSQFERQDLFTGTQQLAYTLAMHYITAAIFRAGMVVGSMDLLGSPTGLVRSVSAGLTDLLRLPYQGLTRSPTAFVSGLFGGVSSLMCNVTAGVMTSMTNFASSVSRNMDRLSLDSGHQQRQEESRRQRPSGLSSGLQQGLTGFGLSLLGAVAGLVDQPLQSVLKQEREQTSATQRAGSIVLGVGRGLVGIFTKPIGGAAELLSQTGQGFLQGSGLKRQVLPRHSIEEIQRSDLPTAWLKYPMKMLGESTLLLAVHAVMQHEGGGGVGEGVGEEVVLLLTGEMVVVVGGDEEEGQQQAFALSQLRCHSPAPAVLVLSLIHTLFHAPAQTGNPNSRDRVAAFIQSAANDSVEGVAWVEDRVPSPAEVTSSRICHMSTPGGGAETPEQQDQASASAYRFRLDPLWAQLFTALFHLASNRQQGRGFSV